MADEIKKVEPKRYLDETGLDEAIKLFRAWIESKESKLLKNTKFKDNALLFFFDPDATEDSDPDFKIDLPAEYFLDAATTTFVEEFEWSEELYPDSTDPDLDGQPVLVLGVKTLEGTEETITYSFVPFTAIAEQKNKADKLKAEYEEDEEDRGIILKDQILVDDGKGNLKGSGTTIEGLINNNFVAYTAAEVEVIFNNAMGIVTEEPPAEDGTENE